MVACSASTRFTYFTDVKLMLETGHIVGFYIDAFTERCRMRLAQCSASTALGEAGAANRTGGSRDTVARVLATLDGFAGARCRGTT